MKNENIIKNGFLSIKTKLLNNWQKRYFVLKIDSISFYKSEKVLK